ncbi:hypothetical protein U1Q18_052011 [Sarracenia purpurea var. burkii]
MTPFHRFCETVCTAIQQAGRLEETVIYYFHNVPAEGAEEQELSNKYGTNRIREIATLLWQYIEHHSPWADRVELERAQQLTALNFLDPAKARQWLYKAKTILVKQEQSGNGLSQWARKIEQDVGLVSQSPATLPDLLPIYDVFFCYNSRDRPQVQRIKEQLKQHDIEARTETHDLERCS